MIRHKDSLFAGISLFISFCILSAGNYLENILPNAATLILILEAGAIILPTVLLRYFLKPDHLLDFRLKLPKKPKGKVKFWIFSALAVAFLAFSANYGCLFLAGYNAMEIPIGLLSENIPLQYNISEFFVLVLFAAAAEEIYFRGALFSAYEKAAGSGICILVSGIVFALMHASPANLAGPLLSGIFYAWLAYAFQSIVPAFAAHAIQNTVYYILLQLSDTYSAFGIWKYLLSLSVLLFLLFAWLAFRQAEKLWEQKAFLPLQRNPNIRLATVFEIVLTPGFIAFLIGYLVKCILRIL